MIDSKMIIKLLNLIIPVLVLYYVYYLEREKCKCVMTWHHYYIKYYLLVVIAFTVSTINIDTDKILKEIIKEESNIGMLVMLPISIAMGIYLYSLYVYVVELEKTQCACAIHDMKYVHKPLYYFRYLIMVLAIIIVIPIFMSIFVLVNNIM